MAIKHYILDSAILLTAPYALLSFDEHNVVLTRDGLEMLENAKTRSGETGTNAKMALQLINKYYSETLPGGGKLIVRHTSTDIIDAAGRYLEADYPVVVTNNDAMQIRAKANQRKVEPYTTEQVVPPTAQYKGRREILISAKTIDAIYQQHGIEASVKDFEPHLIENEYLLLRDDTNLNHTALGVYRKGKILPLYTDALKAYGKTPRNIGQKFALDALLAPVNEIPLVILKGPAGTAKTFLSLAAALEKTINEHAYDKVLVARPNIKFDNDIGYLKGSEEDKIGPLVRPIKDNLEILCRTEPCDKGGKGKTITDYSQDLFDNGTVVAQAMAYMRGRSIANNFILIDEAQNMTPNQAFGIISRVGLDTKLVLAGDIEQIDTPELDSRNNGLSYASEKMKGSPLCAQILFEPDECVRSPLALEAINRMSAKRVISSCVE